MLFLLVEVVEEKPTTMEQGCGGALAYKNNISVTPGQTITVRVGGGGRANGWSKTVRMVVNLV